MITFVQINIDLLLNDSKNLYNNKTAINYPKTRMIELT